MLPLFDPVIMEILNKSSISYIVNIKTEFSNIILLDVKALH
jgi:hypothetical protein